MKILIYTASLLLLFTACNSNNSGSALVDSPALAPVDSASAPVMTFAENTHDFGLITEGDSVDYEFKFTNTGIIPLIITDAQASCGCTIPSYPNTPVAPGKDGVIKVIFNSAAKVGKQNKAITITSNAVPATTTVYLTGEVKERT